MRLPSNPPINLMTDYCPTETWKKITFDSLDIFLENKEGVYVIFDDDERPLYVGRAESLHNRWMSHNQFFPCLREGATFARVTYTDRSKELERHIIVSLKPVLNQRHNNQAAYDNYYKEFGSCPFIYRHRDW